MKKIEIIWRELLFLSLEKNKRRFEQKELAEKFGFSTSTVFQSLRVPRKMGAVRVTGRFFILEDPEKLLYHWASVRNLEKDVFEAFRVEEPVMAVEGKMPPEVIYGAYSATRLRLGAAPADYDKIYVYSSRAETIKERMSIRKGVPNLFILRPDKFLNLYGQKTTLAQTFVDIWNLQDWYAKEFIKVLREKLDAILS